MFDKKDFSSGLFFLIVGLLLAFGSMRFSVWSRYGPGEGFFPLAVAIIIIGVSLFLIFKSFSLVQIKEKGEILEEPQEVSIFKVSSYMILMLLYGVLFESIGFLITSPLFLIFILKYVEKQGWKITILLGLASIIISYLLFVYFLGVPLPWGLLKWW